METIDNSARERIIDAVKSILAEGKTSEKITIREIAKKANVGIGTINYHFQTKEKLLFETVMKSLEGLAAGLATNTEHLKSPLQVLKGFLKESTEMVLKYYEAFKVPISYDLTQGNMNTAGYLVPLLKQIYGDKKNEVEVKIAAIQIIAALQSVYLKERSFNIFTGIDIFDRKQRDELINILLNNLLN